MINEIKGSERLAATEQIHLLKARRYHAADTRDWAPYESLHAKDHHSYHGDYPPWTTAAEMIADVRKIMANLITLHHAHTPEVSFTSSTKADGVWAMKYDIYWTQGEEDHWFHRLLLRNI